MSKEYDFYLHEHKANVAKGFYWIRDNLPRVLDLYYGDVGDLEHQICFAHDASKSDPEEYEAYDRYFYGGNRSYAVVQDFNYAWLRHQNLNPHHWQYWILFEDDPETGVDYVIMDMPVNFVIEMICDWWSFSWAKEDLREIFSWWEAHEKNIKISVKTHKTVVDILAEIKWKLDEMENVNESED